MTFPKPQGTSFEKSTVEFHSEDVKLPNYEKLPVKSSEMSLSNLVSKKVTQTQIYVENPKFERSVFKSYIPFFFDS
jgi:hypothetical protein